MTLDLTHNEVSLVLHALCAVTRSGGGGTLHSLVCKIASQHPDIEVFGAAVVDMQRTAASELRGE